MGDVAQILGGLSGASAASASASTGTGLSGALAATDFKSRASSASQFSRRGGGEDGGSKAASGKQRRIPRELQALVGSGAAAVDLLPSIVPTRTLSLAGLRSRPGWRKAKHWQWKAFSSSARKDGAQFFHWVRTDVEHNDYPFARFNKRSELVRYTEQEYADLFTPPPAEAGKPEPNAVDDIDARWPKEHTDLLFDLCRRYDLRWPVIADRFELKPYHSIEDMKLRFYYVTARVLAARLAANPKDPTAVPLASYATFEYKADVAQRRRLQLDTVFRRSNESLAKERDILKELRTIESAIRKLTRMTPAPQASSTAHLFPGTAALVTRNLAMKKRAAVMPGTTDTASAADTSRRVGMGVTALPQHAGAAAVERNPFLGAALRSAQIAAPVDGMPPGSKTLVKVAALLRDAHVPDRPLACAQVLASVNQLRREAMEFLSLAKAVEAAELELHQLHAARRELVHRKAPEVKVLDAAGKPVRTPSAPVLLKFDTSGLAKATRNVPAEAMTGRAPSAAQYAAAGIAGPAGMAAGGATALRALPGVPTAPTSGGIAPLSRLPAPTATAQIDAAAAAATAAAAAAFAQQAQMQNAAAAGTPGVRSSVAGVGVQAFAGGRLPSAGMPPPPPHASALQAVGMDAAAAAGDAGTPTGASMAGKKRRADGPVDAPTGAVKRARE